jgi:hypothetical protein
LRVRSENKPYLAAAVELVAAALDVDELAAAVLDAAAELDVDVVGEDGVVELAAADEVVELAATVLEAAAELEEDVVEDVVEDIVEDVVEDVEDVVEDVVVELLEEELDEEPAGRRLKTLSLFLPPQVSSLFPSQGMAHPPSVEGTLPGSNTLPQ